LLDEIGIGAARLQMLNLSSQQCADMTEAVSTLVAAIAELGPSPVRRG
jgi:coenzyme F420-reducing hydrogenase delta subunit